MARVHGIGHLALPPTRFSRTVLQAVEVQQEKAYLQGWSILRQTSKPFTTCWTNFAPVTVRHYLQTGWCYLLMEY